jgi:hypothetical protein
MFGVDRRDPECHDPLMSTLRRTTPALVLFASLALGGCTSSTTNASDVTVALAAGSGSTETGTAVLTAITSTTTEVSISTTGGTDTGSQSAVIQSGPCGCTGTVTTLAVLNNINDDASVTTISEELSSIRGDMYSINIHSSTNVDDVVACGEID